jgi:hypothetical protein
MPGVVREMMTVQHIDSVPMEVLPNMNSFMSGHGSELDTVSDYSRECVRKIVLVDVKSKYFFLPHKRLPTKATTNRSVEIHECNGK